MTRYKGRQEGLNFVHRPHPSHCFRFWPRIKCIRGDAGWGTVMFKLILFFIFNTTISFACGYGIREWISRRRRVAAQKEYFERHPDRRHVIG